MVAASCIDGASACGFCRELTTKLNSTAESNRIITQALRMKQEEVEALAAKHESLVQQVRRLKHSDTDAATA